MNEFPCLVIRGICDYADCHKNDVWQEYAAAWKSLLKKYLGIAPATETTARGVDTEPGAEIIAVLDQLAGLDRVENRVALNDFAHTFQHWLERSSRISFFCRSGSSTFLQNFSKCAVRSVEAISFSSAA